ncbi:hypothetical protein GCM10023189_27360 [Nibrella saemangeumensis]|uniref:HTH cro/C1-type domain-containing protein n=1 Tax=Nibrella saemangeumensis TaxID=1084526 RepID=A0ABP8MW27_9BACT
MVQATWIHLKNSDEETVLVEVGHLIREARLRANLTQQELADKLGVSPAVISRYENRGHTISIGTLSRIAQVLQLELLVGFQACGIQQSATRNGRWIGER